LSADQLPLCLWTRVFLDRIIPQHDEWLAIFIIEWLFPIRIEGYYNVPALPEPEGSDQRDGASLLELARDWKFLRVRSLEFDRLLLFIGMDWTTMFRRLPGFRDIDPELLPEVRWWQDARRGAIDLHHF
jgi:hypothetical protein